MLKRTRFLLMISLLALVLGACASPESPATEAPATVEAGTTDETTTEMEQPDLAAAAEQLGVTEEALREALGDPQPRTT